MDAVRCPKYFIMSGRNGVLGFIRFLPQL